MSDDLSRLTVMVFDLSGSYTYIAEALRSDFGSVKYCSQWESGFSHVRDYIPGYGIEGVERVADPFKEFDRCDLVVFPDVGMDGLQEYLRNRGMPVWGSGEYGALERDRIALKKTLTELGMDVADYEVIVGLSALRARLAEQPDLWVKISYFRGVTETYHHKQDFMTEEKMDEWAAVLGPYKEAMVFLVEQPIDGEAVEVGLDTFAVNGEFPAAMMWGYECKDAAYLGTTGKLPDRLAQVSRHFMQRMPNYRGPISNEVRVTQDRDYFVDLTARFPCPPSEAQCMNTMNLGHVIYDGARGILTEPDLRYRYAAQLVMTCEELEEHPVALEIGMPERVYVHGHCVFGGRDYAASPLKIAEFAGAVGLQDSIADAMLEAKEAAESIDGNKVKFDFSAFDQLLDTIKAGDKLGLTFGVFI